MVMKYGSYRIDTRNRSPSVHKWRTMMPFSIPFSTAAVLQDDRTTIPFLLADIGEGIHEVELIKWNVQVGDRVEQFDLICQVQSDKATVDITSRFDGTIIELAGNVGDMVQVGKPLVFLETVTRESSGDRSVVSLDHIVDPLSIAATMNDEFAPRMDIELEPFSAFSGSNISSVKIQTSPAVRKICKERRIDPSVVPATGPHGRLLKADVMAFVQDQNRPTTDDQRPELLFTEVASHTMDEEVVELRGYTRAMAKAMTQSLEIPHMCLGDELDVTQLLAIRKQINEKMTTKISFLAFVIKACSLALDEYPILNAAKNSENSIRMQSQHLIGVAMDTARGLVVPVIGDCSAMSIYEIQERMDSLKESRDDIALDSTRPTFTLSNIGALGAGLSLQPVLVPPQLAMGAIGRLQRLPRFGMNEEVIAVSILPITWAADHRFVDGALLARFHVRVQELLSNPYEMLVRMK